MALLRTIFFCLTLVAAFGGPAMTTDAAADEVQISVGGFELASRDAVHQDGHAEHDDAHVHCCPVHCGTGFALNNPTEIAPPFARFAHYALVREQGGPEPIFLQLRPPRSSTIV